MAGFFVKIAVLLVALVAVTMAIDHSHDNDLANICSDVTCPDTYMPGNYLHGTSDDPCSYCQCVWGRPVKRKCAKYLGWNEMYKQCIPMVGC